MTTCSRFAAKLGGQQPTPTLDPSAPSRSLPRNILLQRSSSNPIHQSRLDQLGAVNKLKWSRKQHLHRTSHLLHLSCRTTPICDRGAQLPTIDRTVSFRLNRDGAESPTTRERTRANSSNNDVKKRPLDLFDPEIAPDLGTSTSAQKSRPRGWSRTRPARPTGRDSNAPSRSMIPTTEDIMVCRPNA